jgi:hypothetical protein
LHIGDGDHVIAIDINHTVNGHNGFKLVVIGYTQDYIHYLLTPDKIVIEATAVHLTH